MAKRTFEHAMTRLEQIVAELEQGELGLDRSLKKFDEGVQLVNFCNEQLEEARSQVELLLQKNNRLAAVPFTDNDRTGKDGLERPDTTTN